MSESKKVAARPSVPKKLVPRPAPKRPPVVEPLEREEVPTAAASANAVPVPVAVAKASRKPSRVDEAVARHQKVLADALTQAQAIRYETPAVVGGESAGERSAKSVRRRKVKLVRDSFAMPEAEYERIAALKKRLSGLQRDTRKNELLRAGVMLLDALNDAELVAVMQRVERIKTGRPKK